MIHTRESVDGLKQRYSNRVTGDVLRQLLLEEMPGQISAVSSFGTESAVLLHMVAQANKNTPVIFIDTLKLFGETLNYRDTLVQHLGLTNIRVIEPLAQSLTQDDPKGMLWSSNPDGCCFIRKVEPLKRALTDVTAWISGRKSFQSATRSNIPQFELVDGKLKINPLAQWSKDDLLNYFDYYKLPRHSMEAEGYPSIGCMPCTTPVAAGEDARAGRWRGQDKIECGIHMPQGQTRRLEVF